MDSANPLARITHGGGRTSAARNVASWHRARNCRRQAVVGARQRRQSNERIFQLPAPAEMRRLCLSINMRRDKAAWSFIRSVGLWVCGSSRASRYALSFITGGFHAHFSPSQPSRSTRERPLVLGRDRPRYTSGYLSAFRFFRIIGE